MSDSDKINDLRRRVRDAREELDALREDGPDGTDDRAREDWEAAIRDLEDEIEACLRRLANYPAIDD